jgi:hypothetical protein
MQVSPQRHQRLRRRRRAARLVALQARAVRTASAPAPTAAVMPQPAGGATAPAAAPRIPAQRRTNTAAVLPGTVTPSAAATD